MMVTRPWIQEANQIAEEYAPAYEPQTQRQYWGDVLGAFAAKAQPGSWENFFGTGLQGIGQYVPMNNQRQAELKRQRENALSQQRLQWASLLKPKEKTGTDSRGGFGAYEVINEIKDEEGNVIAKPGDIHQLWDEQAGTYPLNTIRPYKQFAPKEQGAAKELNRDQQIDYVNTVLDKYNQGVPITGEERSKTQYYFQELGKPTVMESVDENGNVTLTEVAPLINPLDTFKHHGQDTITEFFSGVDLKDPSERIVPGQPYQGPDYEEQQIAPFGYTDTTGLIRSYPEDYETQQIAPTTPDAVGFAPQFPFDVDREEVRLPEDTDEAYGFRDFDTMEQRLPTSPDTIQGYQTRFPLDQEFPVQGPQIHEDYIMDKDQPDTDIPDWQKALMRGSANIRERYTDRVLPEPLPEDYGQAFDQLFQQASPETVPPQSGLGTERVTPPTAEAIPPESGLGTEPIPPVETPQPANQVTPATGASEIPQNEATPEKVTETEARNPGFVIDGNGNMKRIVNVKQKPLSDKAKLDIAEMQKTIIALDKGIKGLFPTASFRPVDPNDSSPYQPGTWDLGYHDNLKTIGGSWFGWWPSKAQAAYKEFEKVMEPYLRFKSGAATPDPEIVRYYRTYVPAFNDSDETARNKAEALNHFFRTAYSLYTAGYDTEAIPVHPPAYEDYVRMKNGETVTVPTYSYGADGKILVDATGRAITTGNQIYVDPADVFDVVPTGQQGGNQGLPDKIPVGNESDFLDWLDQKGGQ